MFQGVFPAMLTPFHENGELDLSRIKPICDWLYENGVSGLFICGTTGEGPSLNAEEKRCVFEKTVKAVEGRMPIIAQATCYHMNETLKAIDAARGMDVKAISLMPPWFYKLDEKEQYEFVKQSAIAAGEKPLFLYNIPQFTGNDMSLDVMRRLLDEFPTIRGVKESGSNDPYGRWKELLSGRFQVICGVDEVVRQFFMDGGKALVASTANVQPLVFHHLVESLFQGDEESAEMHQQQVNRFLPFINGNTIAVIKASMRLLGVDGGYVRPPLRNLDKDEIKKLEVELKKIGVIR